VLGRALVVAQQAADATLAEARAEAERMRREAQAEAARIQDLIEGLRSQVASLSRQLAVAESARPTGAPRRVHQPLEREAAVLVLQEFKATTDTAPAAASVRQAEQTRATVGATAPASALLAPAASAAPAPPIRSSAPAVSAEPAAMPAPAVSNRAEALQRSIRQIPLEAILPIVAIIVVLGIMLAWLG
jgi:chromosome segregation protein